MRLFIVCKHKPDLAFEVLSYDPERHTAELRGRSGIVTDPQFHLDALRADYRLTREEPDCLKR